MKKPQNEVFTPQQEKFEKITRHPRAVRQIMKKFLTITLKNDEFLLEQDDTTVKIFPFSKSEFWKLWAEGDKEKLDESNFWKAWLCLIRYVQAISNDRKHSWRWENRKFHEGNLIK